MQKSSGHPELDQAALEAARQFEFKPARNGAEAVEVWVVVPITFAVRE